MFSARIFIVTIICFISYRNTLAAIDLCGESKFSNICVKLDQKFYLIDGNAMLTWYEADRLCRRQNGYLVTLLNETQKGAISEYLVSKGYLNGDQKFWIGGTDLGSKGKFHSTKTGELLPYTNWSPGQPTNEGNCVALAKHNNAFSMATYDCIQKLRYVCELQEIPNESKKIAVTYKYI